MILRTCPCLQFSYHCNYIKLRLEFRCFPDKELCLPKHWHVCMWWPLYDGEETVCQQWSFWNLMLCQGFLQGSCKNFFIPRLRGEAALRGGTLMKKAEEWVFCDGALLFCEGEEYEVRNIRDPGYMCAWEAGDEYIYIKGGWQKFWDSTILYLTPDEEREAHSRRRRIEKYSIRHEGST